MKWVKQMASIDPCNNVALLSALVSSHKFPKSVSECTDFVGFRQLHLILFEYILFYSCCIQNVSACYYIPFQHIMKLKSAVEFSA
jgi:hypothetical protein